METELKHIVRQHRKISGLTQLELARLAGVGKTVVFDLEHGKQSVQLDTLQRILQVLNISMVLESPLLARQALRRAPGGEAVLARAGTRLISERSEPQARRRHASKG